MGNTEQLPVTYLHASSVGFSVMSRVVSWKRALHIFIGSVKLTLFCLCARLLQAYSAAVQSQLQWMRQLCLCVEQHVKENTAYFQVGGFVSVCFREDEKKICFRSGKRCVRTCLRIYMGKARLKISSVLVSFCCINHHPKKLVA